MYRGSSNKLNELIQYIENHLTEPIEYEKLAKILAVNEYTLHRVFLFITNMSLSEYIRKRRISMAAMELLNSDIKIIDLAIKYQYDSSIAFSRAFKKMMGFNPREAKKNKSFLKLFPILNFEDSSEETKELEYKEIDDFNLYLYGIGREMKISEIPNVAPSLWKEAIQKYPDKEEKLQYGIVSYNNINTKEEDKAIYYVASKEKLKNSQKIEIKNKHYLVFKLNSTVPKDISEFTKKIYRGFIEKFGYSIDNSPDIEEYIGDTTYIHIAIKK